jgi:putative PIN family toxin of toxin-antitoxin system
MVLLQGALSPEGPAFACLRLAESGTVRLLQSPEPLREVTDLLSRPVLRQKFAALTDEVAERFLSRLRSFSEALPSPPRAFTLPRDPQDEIFTDLGVAGRADYLVSWNERHLNYLMKRDTPEGKDFCAKYPNLRILTPVAFLREIASQPP